MAGKTARENAVRSERIFRNSTMSEQLRDFDFRYVAHPAVCALYALSSPVIMASVSGLALDAVVWDVVASVTVAFLVFFLFFWGRRKSPDREPGTLSLALIPVLIIVSQLGARLASPQIILDTPIGDAEPGPEALVLAAAMTTYSVQHILLWLLATVLVAGSLNYRRAKKEQQRLADDIRLARSGSLSESALTTKQRDSVKEISRRVDAIEQALTRSTSDSIPELIDAVRTLRQDVVRPSLEQLNALLAEARSTPGAPDVGAADGSVVPWRWRGVFFSGTVGALLIGVIGLGLLAPASYYFPGLFLQLGIILLAFFLSVPAALLLFAAAALTPLVSPGAQSTGGLAILLLVVVLGAISFLQRFNRVRQVRAVESMSVQGARMAFDQVRRAQDLKVIEERVNSILHGSVQSTLLALELGLQSGDDSVMTHSADAIAHLREAMVELAEPSEHPTQHFEIALDNILSVWAGSVRVSVDQTPESSRTLNSDPLAASAVIEVVKEGTQNAVKHADSRDVRVTIGQEGSLIRVRVTHPSVGTSPTPSPLGHGMRYLQAITSTLRLGDDGVTTTLYAEIPTRVAEAAAVPGSGSA